MRSQALIAAAGLLAAAVPALAATPTASSSASAVSEKPSEAPTIGVVTVHGCYNSAGSMQSNGTLQWCSLGSCGQDMCRNNGWLVGGTMGANHCYCGNEYPNIANLVGDGNCSSTCAGTNLEMCGGDNYWTVYNTGISVVVDQAPVDESGLSSTSSSSSSSSTPETTHIVTESPSANGSETAHTNVAGIAAGTVVGVVAVASAMGGMFFYMRRKRISEIEEAHRSAAAASNVSPSHRSGGSSVSYDTRLNPEMSQRRMSSGSIADNEDYSRRILRVTNA